MTIAWGKVRFLLRFYNHPRVNHLPLHSGNVPLNLAIARGGRLLATMVAVLLLSGCSLLFGGREAAPTATAEATRHSVPTFTPTPSGPSTPAEVPTTLPVATPVVVAIVSPAPPAPVAETLTETVAQTPPTPAPVAETLPTATPPETANVTITAAGVNLRSGPGTEFALAGAATQGETFSAVAKTATGDWWQICCINGEAAWVFGELVNVQNGDTVALAENVPPPPTAAVVEAPVATPVADVPAPEAPVAEAPAPAAPPDPNASSAGFFDPNAQYQIVHFKVLGLAENNGGIRDSRAQHHIFLTVLDAAGNGVNGAVVQNLVGEKGQAVTGDKGPGKAELTMAWEPFKLQVVSDPSGPVTSQISNQMGLAFPHLPDIVGRLGDESYEYGVCPTLEIKCQWPIQLVHFSYEITFQKVK
jgi:uncharacterized protein YraI